MIILHHTNMNSFEDAVSRLCAPSSSVSCHYIINKLNGEITQLVDDNNIAYHAGISSWHKRTKLNNYSIGIELDNDGQEEFSKVLMDSLLILLKKLSTKYKIKPQNILGHLDVAHNRKDDPHYKFNWKLLSNNGFGLYPKVHSNKFIPSLANPIIRLRKFGYKCDSDDDLKTAIFAFNTHFNPESYKHNAVDIWTESSNIYLDDLLLQINQQ